MNRHDMEQFAQRWATAVSRGTGFGELLAEGVDSAPFDARAEAVRERLGELDVHVDELVCEGDRMAWRWTLRAGTTVSRGVNFQRIRGGRLLEHWTLTEPLAAQP